MNHILKAIQQDVALTQKERGCSYHDAWMFQKGLNPHTFEALERGEEVSGGAGLENADAVSESAVQRDIRESIPSWGFQWVGLEAGASFAAFAEALGRTKLTDQRLNTLRTNIVTDYERKQTRPDRLTTWETLKAALPALFADMTPVQFGSYRSYGVDAMGTPLANSASVADVVNSGRFLQTFLPDATRQVLALKGEEKDGLILQRLRMNSLKLTEDQARAAINGMVAAVKSQGADTETALDLVNRNAYAFFRFARVSDPAWEPGAAAGMENSRGRGARLSNIADRY